MDRGIAKPMTPEQKEMWEQYKKEAGLDEDNKRNINNIIAELRYGREENETDTRVDSRRIGGLVERDASSSDLERRRSAEQNEGLDIFVYYKMFCIFALKYILKKRIWLAG